MAWGRGQRRPAAARRRRRCRGGSGLGPELGDERGAVTGRLGRGLASWAGLVRSVQSLFFNIFFQTNKNKRKTK